MKMNSVVFKNHGDPFYKLDLPENKRSNTLSGAKIKIVSALDDGKGYDGLGLNGFVIGKTYLIEVIDLFQAGPETDHPKVTWAYHYQTEEEVCKGVFENGTGHVISLTIENLDVCGRFLKIYAMANGVEETASIEVWVHFRFRYFSRKIITEEIDSRIKHPFLISQNSTSLCGMAAVFYAFLKVNPLQYKTIVLELHRKGTITLNNYTVKPNALMFDVNPTADNLDFPGLNKRSNGLLIPMPQVDWMLLASVRSSLSPLNYKGADGDNLKAINWPGIVKKVLKDFLGYKTIIDHTRYYTGFNYKGELLQLHEDYENGYQIIFLIDANMLENKVRYLLNALDWHYIVYEGDLSFDEHKNYIFSYYSWGRIYKKQAIRSSVFNSTFYGYYKIKM